MKKSFDGSGRRSIISHNMRSTVLRGGPHTVSWGTALKTDPAQYQEWAQLAVSSYLENGVSLNDSIAKVANENHLTPTQVKQVCQQANVATYESLFPTQEDKTFTFPIANPNEIIQSIEQTEKVASDSKIPADYYLEPPKPELHGDVNTIFGVEELSNEHQVAEKIAQLNKLRENFKLAADEIRSRQQDSDLAIEAARESARHEVEQFILVDDNPDRLETMKKVAKAIRLGIPEGNQKVAFAEFIKISESLVRKGIFGALAQFQIEKDSGETVRNAIADLSKEAEAVQADLISKTQLTGTEAPLDKVKVVNGNHPILVSINQLVNQVAEEDRLKQGLMLLEDKASYAITKINDLNTSALTDKYVQGETYERQQAIEGDARPEDRRFAQPG